MKPFIKWAGGKGQLAKTLIEYFPQKIDRYFEPFLGGGAMFFYLASNGHLDHAEDIVLNDINTDLMTTWGQVRGNIDYLIQSLAWHSISHEQGPKEFYANIRKFYNDPATRVTQLMIATWFIYLNKAGFNGLYRVNSKGHFNVPFGKKEKVSLFDHDNLMDIHALLNKPNICLENMSYEQVPLLSTNGKYFVYLDPPYVPLNPTSSFTSYTADGFNIRQQEQLGEYCHWLNDMGMKFALSNSATDLVRDIYAGFNIYEVEATRRINSKGDSRGKITELLVTNYEQGA